MSAGGSARMRASRLSNIFCSRWRVTAHCNFGVSNLAASTFMPKRPARGPTPAQSPSVPTSRCSSALCSCKAAAVRCSGRKGSLKRCRVALVERPVAEDWSKHGEETPVDGEILASAVEELRHRAAQRADECRRIHIFKRAETPRARMSSKFVASAVKYSFR